MPALTVTKTYSNGNTLSETDLDNIKNSIETFFNTTKIDTANIQAGVITTTQLSASAAIVGTQLASGTITATQLASGIILPGNPGSVGTFAVGTSLSLSSGALTLTYVTTTPSVNRLQLNAGLQPTSSTTSIIQKFSSSTRTLELADSSTGTARPIVTSAAPSTHGLMIVRGSFYYNGSAMVTLSGEGFTPTRNGVGNYNITFSTAFSDTPSVVATWGFGYINSNSFSTTTGQVFTFDRSGVATELGTTSANACSFIAIGQRSA